MLISLEGGPGSGTGRQAALLAEWLEAAGVAVEVVTCGDSWLMRDVLPLVEARPNPGHVTAFLCRLTDLVDLYVDHVQSGLRAGFVVVCDRYVYTLIAHGRAQRLDPDWLERVTAVLPSSDLALYLRSTPMRQLRRLLLASRAPDGWEAGSGWTRPGDLGTAFRLYGARVERQLAEICRVRGLIQMEGDGDEGRLHEQIRERIQDALEGVR